MAADNSLLMQLAEMFPDHRLETLARCLEDSNNDVNLACSMVISGTHINIGEDLHNDNTTLDELYSLFPQIPRDDIQTAYYEHKGNKEKLFDSNEVVLELLSLESIRNQKLEIDQPVLSSTVKADENTSKWGKTHNNIETIIRYTNVDRERASKYYTNNLFSAPLAIISIIRDGYEQPIISKTNTTNRKTAFRKGAIRGGRVQSSHGIAHRKQNGLDLKTENSFEHLCDVTDNMSETISTVEAPTYEDVADLKKLLSGEQTLSAFNMEFINKAYRYYHLNLDKLASLINYLKLNSASKLTFITAEKMSAESLQHSTDDVGMRVPYSKTIKKKSTVNTSPALTKNMIQGKENFQIANKMVVEFFNTYKLDFHGFLPQEAVRIADICLTQWWAEELSNRELNAGKLNMKKSQYMSPVTLITGRGIHSAGGFSKVRIAIVKYLQNNYYIFEEFPSYFIVNGKGKVFG